MMTENLRSKSFGIKHEKKNPFVSQQSPHAPLQARMKYDRARDFLVIYLSLTQEEGPADCPVQYSVLKCFLLLRKTKLNVM